jgi:hypothetical protein
MKNRILGAISVVLIFILAVCVLAVSVGICQQVVNRGFVTGKSGLLVDPNYRMIPTSFNYAKITTNASTQVKTGAGTLQSIIVSSPGSAWTIQVFDNSSCAAPAIFGATAVTVPAAGSVINFNVDFNTGLCVTTAGTTPGEVTITSR